MSRWRWLLGTALVTLVAVTSWSHPQVSSATSARAADDGATAGVSGPRIATPWQPGRAQLGIHVYWEDNPLDDDLAVRRKARRLLDQIVGMEADSVAVSFPFFVESITGSSVRTDPRTPAPGRLAIVLNEAREAGLRTTIRPLMDQNNLQLAGSESWRGRFAPADRTAWYASYDAFLRPYLALARDAGVATVVIGAELNATQLDPQWRELVASARKSYDGELGYSANWDAYPTAVVGVPVDIVNIDAYPTLDIDSDATEQEIMFAWGDWLDRTGDGAVAALVLAEVGGPAESTLVRNPAAYHTPGAALDEDAQRRWFAGACAAARERDVAGFYWWTLDFHRDPAMADPDHDRHDSFLGRQAERVIRDCFTAWGASR